MVPAFFTHWEVVFFKFAGDRTRRVFVISVINRDRGNP